MNQLESPTTQPEQAVVFPPEGDYDLLCVSHFYAEDVVNRFEPDKPPRDEVSLTFELVGTSNPVNNEPFTVKLFSLRKVNILAPVLELTQEDGTKRSTRVETGVFRLLSKMMLSLPDDFKFDDINWKGVEGCYARGHVVHHPNGKYLKLSKSNILTMTNTEHITHNIRRLSIVTTKEG